MYMIADVYLSLPTGVFLFTRNECQNVCISELHPSHIVHVKPSLINSLSLLNQVNPLVTIFSKQLLSRESMAQYLIL